MILADTSVWVGHLRHGDERLAALLEGGTILMHPFVLGEIALGSLHRRRIVLGAMHDLPQTLVATDEEVLDLIERRTLFSLGIGYVDAHLIAAVYLTVGAALWTRDKRLHKVAQKLSIAATA